MKPTVALLLFDDVEVLDFAGPFEVFSVTNELSGDKFFHVVTVAEERRLIRARNGLHVMPDHALADCPAPAVLIVPGGVGTRPLLQNPRVLAWVESVAASAQHVVSVCTGSLVLARLGLLAGRDATTHHECFDLLRSLAPTARVSESARFLDNGQILTSAGISAGLDVSLHLVARLHGVATARRTAAYMEYHWREDGGTTR
ncbi:MAG: DJ-1/PfpI family protein [Opitutae bacterium]|nr:DJ-1/PfpI family protein [Opitutae bacterium]